MPRLTEGAIDSDVHPAPPAMKALLPYLDDYWRESILSRGIDRTPFDMTAFPPDAPTAARPDWRPKRGAPAGDPATLGAEALDRFGSRFAVLNCLHGAMTVYSEDMAAVLCRAINQWLSSEWLDRDPRLRASIVVPAQSPELAAQEIERSGTDRRFVQVLMLVLGDMPLGRRHYWPIYRAAERLGLPIGIHAGSAYRHAPTGVGWPSYYLEDYVANAQGFETQLLSLVAEGVFQKFPALRVVLIESGVTWLPGFLWRANKTWRGVRAEVPWLTRPPAEIIRDHVRLTLQPLDAPPTAEQLERVVEQIGSERMLLFSTDYPHWQFEGDAAVPPAFPPQHLARLLSHNALDTYPRLTEAA